MQGQDRVQRLSDNASENARDTAGSEVYLGVQSADLYFMHSHACMHACAQVGLEHGSPAGELVTSMTWVGG